MDTTAVDLTDVTQRARGGDADAIAALIRLVETAERAPNQVDIAWRAIPALVERLHTEDRTLNGDDMGLAREICLEISEHADLIPFLNVEVSRIPGFMDRVQLYKDDKIVIRAHLFHGAANEGFIHNHGQAMISTALEGSYVHKIFEINTVQGTHYRFSRTPGGILEGEYDAGGNIQHTGEVENVLCQPFDAGQSLFISALAKHTVCGTSERVSTITIRDANKRYNTSDVVSATRSIEANTSDIVEIIEDIDEQRRIKTKLKAAILAFRAKLIPAPATEAYMEVFRQMNDEIGHTRAVVDASHDEIVQTRQTVDVTHGHVVHTQHLVQQLLICQQLSDTRENREAVAREREVIRDGLVLSGAYFPFHLLGRQGIPGSDVLGVRLRAECLRLGVPDDSITAFLDANNEELDLLRPYLSRQVLMVLNYLRGQMGSPNVLPRQDSDNIEAHLATFDYPPTIAGMPLEQRRQECLHWIARFASTH